jgi:excisionase family DNA binding protein
MISGDRTYSAQEISDRLGVAEKTVRRWIDSGRLQADRIGRRFAIELGEAERVHAESRSGRAAGREAEAASEVRRLQTELAVMSGRHEELQRLVSRLEAALAEEQRRSAVLEARMELRAVA